MIPEPRLAAVHPPLDPARWQEVKDALIRALEHPAAARTAFLRGLCGNDTTVYREAADLLHQSTGGFDACADPFALPGHETADPNAGRRVGAWTLAERLGAGGTGTVYLARRADGAFEQGLPSSSCAGARTPTRSCAASAPNARSSPGSTTRASCAFSTAG